MFHASNVSPGSARWRRRALAATLVVLASAGPFASSASASGNASAAAGFIENAQNSDGGFSETHGQPSDPAASLWATVALLAAGKNPQDERINNGATADEYLAAHLSSYRSLTDLGLLAVAEAASGAPSARYGDPGAQLRADLTVPAINADPGGAALGVIGLLALHQNRAAQDTTRTLLSAPLADGGWGTAGASDSASTALVLEAAAQTGIPTGGGSAVSQAIQYLHKAQVNDGSIGASDRTDTGALSGDVAATAFTIQALEALHHPTLRTPTGTSVLDGLANYQQLTSGGLSPSGAYDTTQAPSVTQTAQAYPAFDGAALPLPYVAPVLSTATHTTTGGNRASSGTAGAGVSSNTGSGSQIVGAYQGASAAGSLKSRPGRGGAGQGQQVTGSVVGAGSAPKLTTRSGRAPAKDLTTLYLALLLLGVAGGGAVLDWRRPSGRSRSTAAVVVQALSDLLAAARRRRALGPATVVLLGAVLVALPPLTGMWSRAPKGATMIKAFKPYMQPAQLDRLQTDVDVLNTGVRQTAARAPALQFPHATDAAKRFAAADPTFSSFAGNWPAIDGRLTRLLTPIRANRANYRAVASLPSFRLFPWFLLVPGVVLVLLGTVALVLPEAWRRSRLGVATLGAALILAPLALGLFGAGGKGAHLVSAFRAVETRSTVVAVQNDFGSLAVGQGSLRTELPPKVAASLPAVTALNNRWIAILGDFTPMLGVMSDNVQNYQAVAGLPSFTAFPWLFAVSGALAIVVALLGSAVSPVVVRRRVRAVQAQLQARSSA